MYCSDGTNEQNQQKRPRGQPLPQKPGRSSSFDKYERFENWLRENGAQFDLLELREYDDSSSTGLAKEQHHDHDNDEAEEKKEQQLPTDDSSPGDSEMRGVHARTRLPPNTVCVAIPRRCLITVEMGQQTPIGQAITRSDLDLDAPKHIFLMVYLLWDRKVNGSNSFFHPYYEILPQTLGNMPIFWSPQELDYLAGSYLLQQIEDRNEAIADDYYAICQIAPLAKICTLQEFKWARMCVCSRNFGLQIDGHRTSALVPHADMLNHYRPRETKWTFDEERQAFTITTLQSIQAGAQVYDSYGQKCNHRFLLNYGFAVEDNRELDGFCPNEVPIELNLNPEDPLYQHKLEFWIRGELNLTAALAPSLATATAAAARSSPAAHAKRRLSMMTLLGIISVALGQYPTSLSVDKADLLDERRFPPFSNQRHAKIQVRGEKEVLYHFAAWARTALEVLDVIERELKEEQQRGSVEVQLGRGVIVNDDVAPPRIGGGFDALIRKMEDDDHPENDCLHYTIVRYCADVLGSLRREELKSLRRQRATLAATSLKSGGDGGNKGGGNGYC
eukprot:jgi/Psemu1/258626/estExt_Genewise1Plus.C_2900062